MQNFGPFGSLQKNNMYYSISTFKTDDNFCGFYKAFWLNTNSFSSIFDVSESKSEEEKTSRETKRETTLVYIYTNTLTDTFIGETGVSIW